MPRPKKPPELRQRRNKATTRAKLRLGGPSGKAPTLPIRGCQCGGPRLEPKPKKRGRGRPRKEQRACETCQGSGILPWNPLTIAWWRRLWSSPQAGEFIESDVDPLYELASLKDAFWATGGTDAKLASEIRQRAAQYGATALDRLRLEWELEKPEEPEGPADKPEAPPPVVDPRVGMRLVR